MTSKQIIETNPDRFQVNFFINMETALGSAVTVNNGVVFQLVWLHSPCWPCFFLSHCGASWEIDPSENLSQRGQRGHESWELTVVAFWVCKNISSFPTPPLIPCLYFACEKTGEREELLLPNKKHKGGIFPDYFSQNPLFKWNTRREG